MVTRQGGVVHMQYTNILYNKLKFHEIKGSVFGVSLETIAYDVCLGMFITK